MRSIIIYLKTLELSLMGLLKLCCYHFKVPFPLYHLFHSNGHIIIRKFWESDGKLCLWHNFIDRLNVITHNCLNQRDGLLSFPFKATLLTDKDGDMILWKYIHYTHYSFLFPLKY